VLAHKVVPLIHVCSAKFALHAGFIGRALIHRVPMYRTRQLRMVLRAEMLLSAHYIVRSRGTDGGSAAASGGNSAADGGSAAENSGNAAADSGSAAAQPGTDDAATSTSANSGESSR
jgi:hypothetical protein